MTKSLMERQGRVMPNSVDMTDAEDLESERMDIVKAEANLKKQKNQYRAKKYKNSGGVLHAKLRNTLVDILQMLLIAAIGGLVVFYLLTLKNETSSIIYFSRPDTGTTKLVLPESLPPTGA